MSELASRVWERSGLPLSYSVKALAAGGQILFVPFMAMNADPFVVVEATMANASPVTTGT